MSKERWRFIRPICFFLFLFLLLFRFALISIWFDCNALVIPVRILRCFFFVLQKSPPIIDDLSSATFFLCRILIQLTIFAYTIAIDFVTLIHIVKHSSGYVISLMIWLIIANHILLIVNSKWKIIGPMTRLLLWSHSQCFLLFYY